MTIDVSHVDAFNHGLSKLRALLMALHGTESAIDPKEGDALTMLCWGAIKDFEHLECALDAAAPAPALAA